MKQHLSGKLLVIPGKVMTTMIFLNRYPRNADGNE